MSTFAPTQAPTDDSGDGPIFIVIMVSVSVGLLCCLGFIGFCCKRAIYWTSPEGREMKKKDKERAEQLKIEKKKKKRQKNDEEDFSEDGGSSTDGESTHYTWERGSSGSYSRGSSTLKGSRRDPGSSTSRRISLAGGATSAPRSGSAKEAGSSIGLEKSTFRSESSAQASLVDSDSDDEDNVLGSADDRLRGRRLEDELNEQRQRRAAMMAGEEEENPFTAVDLSPKRSLGRSFVSGPTRRVSLAHVASPLLSRKTQQQIDLEEELEAVERARFLQSTEKKKTAPLPLLPYIPPALVAAPQRPLAQLQSLKNADGEEVADWAARLHREPAQAKRFAEVHPAEFLRNKDYL